MAHSLACERTSVRSLAGYDKDGNLRFPAIIPRKYVESLEQNQKIATCCRHPENHQIEAWYSCDEEKEKNKPDIYKFFCTCGRVHVRFCAGGDNPNSGELDVRPMWDVR